MRIRKTKVEDRLRNTHQIAFIIDWMNSSGYNLQPLNVISDNLDNWIVTWFLTSSWAGQRSCTEYDEGIQFAVSNLESIGFIPSHKVTTKKQ